MNKAAFIVLVVATAVAVSGGLVWWELSRYGAESTISMTTTGTVTYTTYTTTVTVTVTVTAPLNTLTTTPWVQEPIEALIIYPDNHVHVNGTLVLHIANRGSAPAIIYKVVITGEGEAQLLSATGTGVTLSKGEVRVEPGGEGYIWAQLDKTLVQNRVYIAKIYTRSGNVYSIAINCIP